jgi:hypothetical protein
MSINDMHTKLIRFTFQGKYIPMSMHGGIMRYLEKHIPPGDFLSAIISNDLKRACQAADDTNLWLIPVYTAFFYNYAPSDCWGSKEKLDRWLSLREVSNEQAVGDLS